MENEGVLKPVEVSDWATPIVCVPKTDGSVRICGDYKGTVNPAIQTEQFPIPTLEEIRGNVSTWKKFTKTDLRRAYQQLVLDEESQKLCTINTHKGLFQYTRLCAHSRWPEIFMARNTSAKATITILRELFAKYGLPVHCVSDNGPQFRSEEFAHFLKMNGVKHTSNSLSCGKQRFSRTDGSALQEPHEDL